MSPATNILGSLVRHGDGLPLVVEQAEDEIAAVNMVARCQKEKITALLLAAG